jgi:acyl dehydratase
MAVPGDPDLDDFVVGQIVEFGQTTVTEESIIAFGREFDPLPWHTDPVAAPWGPFGGLIACGWHTVAMTHRMYSGHFLASPRFLAGLAVKEVLNIEPVRPCMPRTGKLHVDEVKPSSSKPDRGTVTFTTHTVAQGTIVQSMTGVLLWQREV